MQLTGELPEIKKAGKMGDQEKTRQLAHALKIKDQGKAATEAGDGQARNVRPPNVVRMKELNIDDYYTGSDKEKDERVVQFFFN